MSEILEVKTATEVDQPGHEELRRELTHYFEIKTQTSTYFIGELGRDWKTSVSATDRKHVPH